MVDTAVLSTPTVAKRGRPKTVKQVTVAKSTPKVKKPKAKAAAHPPTSEMVLAAISSLNEKGGSSLYPIKKYISSKYKLDSSKAGIFIRKFLVSAVASGKLAQTKGTGATGSFKIPSKEKGTKKTVKTMKISSKKPKAASSPTKPKPKKLKVTSKPKKALKVPKAGTRVVPKRK